MIPTTMGSFISPVGTAIDDFAFHRERFELTDSSPPLISNSTTDARTCPGSIKAQGTQIGYRLKLCSSALSLVLQR